MTPIPVDRERRQWRDLEDVRLKSIGIHFAFSRVAETIRTRTDVTFHGNKWVFIPIVQTGVPVVGSNLQLSLINHLTEIEFHLETLPVDPGLEPELLAPLVDQWCSVRKGSGEVELDSKHIQARRIIANDSYLLSAIG